MTTLAPVRDPRTGRVISEVPLLPTDGVPAVARRAAAAFPAWSRTPVANRADLVAGIARVLAERVPDLVSAFSRETGKTHAEAEAELHRSVDTLRWTAGAAADALGPVTLPDRDGLDRVVTAEPAGPALAIVPSNFPAVVLARKLGPALAMGCSVVVKGPETTPSVIRAFAAAARDAGLPEDVLQTVFTTPEGTAALVRQPEFRTISFTGSTRTGRLVAAEAAVTLAQCVLELGGHAPAIITEHADLELAVAALVPMKFNTAGQSCSAPSRFLVHESIHDAFVTCLKAAVPRLDCAGGTMGPLHTPDRQKAVHQLVQDALTRGATVVTGGEPPDVPGYYFPATILTDVPPDAAVLTEEPFGPLAPVISYRTEAEAIALANATPYALGAFVYGSPGLAAHLNAGRVSVNCASGADPESPLGGRADSGHGYEGGTQGMHAYTRLKVTLTPGS
ncbi:MAG: aldehyde dehydrogenase family protein [Streptosporangiaceae bacterium]